MIHRLIKFFGRKRVLRYLVLPCAVLATAFVFCLPDPLFTDPTSTVLEDRSGELLVAKIATDGQWRFPEDQEIPDKFKEAILHFEDEYFYIHPGVNPISLFRATRQNIREGRIISGGSTISMQVIRLSRKGKPRTILEKLWEIILALRLEIRYSKDEILSLYMSHAPFGGNIVGLKAASWRYYGRDPDQLSWGEMAALAVLPNAPALIYPGKNQHQLQKKRNRLIDKLSREGIIDSLTGELAKAEPLPGKPKPLPQNTPHLLTRSCAEGHEGKLLKTTIDHELQDQLNKIGKKYHHALSQNEIHNLAVVVIDIRRNEIAGYLGNAPCDHVDTGADVDIITAPRSTGSILKPFLYASVLHDGEYLPNALIADIPTRISGYAPKNFEKSYDGVVPLSNALTRSLNVPAVRVLQQYSLEKFHNKLKKLKLSTINRPANHYGLSLVLGGAEATLWDLVSAYSGMARSLNQFRENSSQYSSSDYDHPTYLLQKQKENTENSLSQSSVFDAASIWQTFETLANVTRPREERGWESFGSSRKVAWKTGTSFGHRDAWAIGVTPEYVVGVWVGNADGEGRPGLLGLSVAGPVLFDVFNLLPSTTWFEKPYDELIQIAVCAKSGYRFSIYCEQADTVLVPKAAVKVGVCSFHKVVHLDKEGNYRVSADCYPVNDMVRKSWFVLPPVQAWYFKTKDPHYRQLPPYASGCHPTDERNMAFIYPENLTKIFIPRQLDGTLGTAIFEVAHRKQEETVYWHLDDKYLGSTSGNHKMEVVTGEGIHYLTLIDEEGEELKSKFEVMVR